MSDPIPHQDISYYEAWKTDLAVETVWHNPDTDFLAILAPHGGDIETQTDTAAVEMYKKMPNNSTSLWMFQGFDSTETNDNKAKRQYHVTSSEISSKQFPAIGEIDDVGFQYCVSFHIKRNAEVFEIGGLADKGIREDVAETLVGTTGGEWNAITDHDEGEYMAVSEQNITNRLTDDSQSGVQIEMPGRAAKIYRKSIAEDLAEYFTKLYRR